MSQPEQFEPDFKHFAGTDVPTSFFNPEEVDIDEYFTDLAHAQLPGLIHAERARRAESFEVAHAAIKSWQETFADKPTFHRTFVDRDGLPIERRAVVEMLAFPGLGPMSRIIVNDEGIDEQDMDVRKLCVRDYLISNCAKAFSWQETTLTRPGTATSWSNLGNTGPIIQQRSDHISLLNGPNYSTFLPRVGGYTTTFYESVERRLRLEEFTTTLATLGPATYEPGYEVKPYF